ncbi:MAG TPA: hypothetical protein DEO84_05125, partial [candidate division Zixibacteria bacterium]|nr:hypothetical protein [candidate division Zixibacteria bacterium]
MPVKKQKPSPKKTTKVKHSKPAAKPIVKAAAPAKKAVESKKPMAVKEIARGGKYLYYFGDGKAEGNSKMKDLLGGKGSGLAEMTNSGVPVP